MNREMFEVAAIIIAWMIIAIVIFGFLAGVVHADTQVTIKTSLTIAPVVYLEAGDCIENFCCIEEGGDLICSGKEEKQ